jgi:hypothetical protein
MISRVFEVPYVVRGTSLVLTRAGSVGDERSDRRDTMTRRQEQEQRRQDRIRALELWNVQAASIQARLDQVAHRLQAQFPSGGVEAEIADQGQPEACAEMGDSPESLANVSLEVDLSLDEAELLADAIEAGLAYLSERGDETS